MKNGTKIVIGLLLILFGSILFLDRAGMWDYLNFDIWSVVSTFWPLILIAIGIRLIVYRNTVAGTLITVVGGMIFLSNIFDRNFFSFLWPVLIISLGLSIIFKKDEEDSLDSKKKYKGERIDDTVVFWGSEKKIVSKDFRGGEVNAIFGGYELDLRDCQISKEGARLEINAVFGGIDVYVPKNCRIITDGIGILGGWEPKLSENDIKEPVLRISGSAIFGGVEIKE